jgi:hypothetical protein
MSPSKTISFLILLYEYISHLYDEMEKYPLRINGYFEIDKSLPEA